MYTQYIFTHTLSHTHTHTHGQELYLSSCKLHSVFSSPAVRSSSPLSPMELLHRSSTRTFEELDPTVEPRALQHLIVSPQLPSLEYNVGIINTKKYDFTF